MVRTYRWLTLFGFLALVLAACVTVTVTPSGDVIVTVCDFEGLPFDDIDVRLGDRVMRTDANGQATFRNVEGPFDLAVADPITRRLNYYQGLDTDAVSVVLPGGQGSAGSGASVTGTISGATGGTSTHLSAAVAVDGRSFPAAIDTGSHTFSAGVRYLGSGDQEALVKVAETDLVTGDLFVGVNSATVSPGSSGSTDVNLAALTMEDVNVDFGAIPGLDRTQIAIAGLFGVELNGAMETMPLLLGQWDDPARTQTMRLGRVPLGWSVEYTLAATHKGADDAGILLSRPGLAPDVGTYVFVPGVTEVSDLRGFRNGDSFGVGTRFNFASMSSSGGTNSLRFDPLDPLGWTLAFFTASNFFVMPDLSDLGVDFADGDEYGLRSRYFSWPIDTLASKRADALVQEQFISHDGDLDVAYSREYNARVGAGPAPTTGSLQIDVDPNDASGMVSGPGGFSERFTGDTTLDDLVPGLYAIVASLTGYRDRSGTAMVEAGDTAKVMLLLEEIPGPTPRDPEVRELISGYLNPEGMLRRRIADELKSGDRGERQVDPNCPDIVISATGGSLIVDACDGSLVKQYPDFIPGLAHFDTLILPLPDGETGFGGLFQTGPGYALSPLDANGDIAGLTTVNSGGGPFTDSNYLGNDPEGGGVFINAGAGSVRFVVVDPDAGPDGQEPVSPDGLFPGDLTPNASSYNAVTAAANADGSRLLVAASNSDGLGGNNLLYVEQDAPDTTFGVRVQAVASVTDAGLLGSNPRRVRCDLAAGTCAVSDFADSTVTIVAWDGDGAPTIVATADVADGPVGIDVLGNRIVSAGFNDDQFSVVTLNADRTVASVDTRPLPPACDAPGHAIFVGDADNSVLVSCNASSNYVYYPDAF